MPSLSLRGRLHLVARHHSSRHHIHRLSYRCHPEVLPHIGSKGRLDRHQAHLLVI